MNIKVAIDRFEQQCLGDVPRAIVEEVVAVTERRETGRLGFPVFIGDPVKIGRHVSRMVQLEAGSCIHERYSWTDLVLTIMRGRCGVELAGETECELSAGEQIQIPANLAHRIETREAVRAVVTFDDAG